ncbi:CoA-binding protein [Roseobacter sp. HKCCD9010]|uniref:acetate--CoA ligase family protein n=1 Tax=unclassified Roseobacter TaxID=196798 RepID=UPI001491AA47|nr:CoA-binding protein [Rhodobacterales bacterium HKCCD4356]NNV14495.1 CoA-binding protein [Roseobacter sp. HKCCD7357]NNV18756.1 CoA-binding protein [Roseobacter sp. HKCCD8768]NNV28217.1 CoA-binding protein [Roseobacter sp. HKCCD8192]NNV32489.1 CoA-binding protein [Roseobacter sp. HKCCD9061]NNV36747.1 CoA-binding protein [Roseobacter sp. HKCCD9073]NNV40998.1 CoA-binding protein [Roseobacter sp. HKCCD9054]NNV45242.1 CoA-binding protein [Roseobacter sp. HKCCD6497]NNV49497.1 CoA-binding protei
MSDGISRLLRPRSIAVIGGGNWCANVVEQCQKIGFSGDIWPVHPKRDTVAGVAAFAKIEDLPEAPDAAFIGINRDLTIEAVQALAEKGTGGVVCFASGFLEAQAETFDGASKQEELLHVAGDMTVLGPNCYGFLNYLDGAALWPDQHGGVRTESGVAIVTQSSNIAINLTMQNRGLPVAYVVTAGNQAQTGLSDISCALLEDPRVTALGLHIEGVDDLRAFERMAQTARRVGKPIVALKIGKSDQAQAATISHTASLAGSDAGARALLDRLGIGQAESLPTLLETLKLLHIAGPLLSNRVASMSCSGGEASLIADSAHGSALVFPALDTEQQTGLRAALGPKVALANPLDYHTYIWGDEDALTQTFTAMMQGDLAMGCVVLDFPRSDRCDVSSWEPVIVAAARAKKATGRPMAILASLQEAMPEEVSLRLVELGIVPFSGMDDAVAAMDIAAKLAQDAGEAPPLLLPPAPGSERTLTEAEAKLALSAHGVRVPGSARADSAQAAADAATQIGFPIVLKGEGIAHKTEAGAVALNLDSAKAVMTTATAMPTESFLVEEMITDTVAELLVGVVADPLHGYVLTLAAGGVLTELLGDYVSLLLPTTPEEIRASLDGLRVARSLKGYRGKPGADIEAIVDTVLALQAYVAASAPQEVEINPLMCGTDKAVAADALIRIGE